jgi:hypothetical protein
MAYYGVLGPKGTAQGRDRQGGAAIKATVALPDVKRASRTPAR